MFLLCQDLHTLKNSDLRNERRRRGNLQGFQTYMIVSSCFCQLRKQIPARLWRRKISRRMMLIKSRMLSAFVYVGESEHMHVLMTVWQTLGRDH